MIHVNKMVSPSLQVFKHIVCSVCDFHKKCETATMHADLGKEARMHASNDVQKCSCLVDMAVFKKAYQ